MKTNRFIISVLSAVSLLLTLTPATAQENTLRAPAYPLLMIDPYTSCWSAGNYLYDQHTTHWTGQPFPLIGALRVDGRVYRFMGLDAPTGPFDPNIGGQRHLSTPAVQQSVDVQATRTIYRFVCGPVELTLTFSAPLLPDELDLISRPVNYISYSVRTLDQAAHDMQIYFEASPACATNTAEQPSAAQTDRWDNLISVRTGSTDQKILQRKGDQIKIDWGYFHLCAEKEGTTHATGSAADLRRAFAAQGRLDEASVSENANIALARDLGRSARTQGIILAGFDDIRSIQYFKTDLRPYWNRSGSNTIRQQFAQALRDYRTLAERCEAFDRELMETATRCGGRKYAELCALAYRQAIAAHKLVEAPNGDLLFLSKENASNGSIGTVDISYPSAPMFLYYNPELCKALLNHIFYYSGSGKWSKPFPAHDVGTYPQANGQTYKHDMPVEESGNMLVLTAAIAAVEQHAEYARKHWDVLTVWADYLVEHGLDPADQLCTDDFAGHFAHNANLSIKAIMGIASYGYCARRLGMHDTADTYLAKAREMAAKWMAMADNGTHYRLTFDKPDTWSQKYNLVWDKLLGFDLFPASVARKEIASYLGRQNRYGLPLDNRRLWTKADWIVWSATLAEDKATFEQFIEPLWAFMNETVQRVPMSDWYKTDVPAHVGFKARSVVGGYWIKMLEEKMNNLK